MYWFSEIKGTKIHTEKLELRKLPEFQLKENI